MSKRGASRGAGGGGAGSPFYAPTRRKTSAEIISEARAALYGDVGSSHGGGSVLRALPTRRPYTPRDPQRNLFADRRKDARPPSAYDLKHSILKESIEETDDLLVTAGRTKSLDEEHFVVAQHEKTGDVRKKISHRSPQLRQGTDRTSTEWSGYTKLPHLSGRTKPLHKRNTSSFEETKSEPGLANAISITQPFGPGEYNQWSKTTSESGKVAYKSDSSDKRKLYSSTKSKSCDVDRVADSGAFGDVAIKHLTVQLSGQKRNEVSQLSTLELAEKLSQKNLDEDTVLALLDALYRAVERSVPANVLKDMILKSLYTHIDSDDERVLVCIARIMLALKVTGTHLSAACKLVFKIAKSDKNDHFFKNTNLLELLLEGFGRAEPLSECDCCVFAAGALRFLTLEPTLRSLASRAGATHLLALHLNILNNAKCEKPRRTAEYRLSERSSHALYQLTGALRNLAGGPPGELAAFVSSGALQHLLLALELHHTDRDVLTNVVRCLSVLSADEACCAWLCACEDSARAMLCTLATCAQRAALAVRLAYALGNMAAADERARINIYNEYSSMDILLTILETYSQRNDRELRDHDVDHDSQLIGNDLGGSDGSNEDVLIKTVRVIANLCLTEQIGRDLAEKHSERILKVLIDCLELAEKTLPGTDAISDLEGGETNEERHQELATASLATLNNVTFYREPPPTPQPHVEELNVQVCQAVSAWLYCDITGTSAAAAASEAVRALGNVTRCAAAAHCALRRGVVGQLAPFLQHDEVSIRCAAAGVLVNICAAQHADEAVSAAAAALQMHAHSRDAATAALLARALWNAHAHNALAPVHAQRAVAALDQFIDDESVFAACEAPSLRASDRRASDPDLYKHRVRFDTDNNNEPYPALKHFVKSNSIDHDLNRDVYEGDQAYPGEDLGFEDGEFEGEFGCECGPCRRLTEWEELVGVAIPLLEKLRPVKTDAAVGTDS